MRLGARVAFFLIDGKKRKKEKCPTREVLFMLEGAKGIKVNRKLKKVNGDWKEMTQKAKN